MKKLNSFFSILLLLLAVLFAQNSWGQSTANYTPSTATDGSLIDMSSGTTDIFATGTYRDDDASSVINIGFTYYFMGTSYTQFSINSNGQMRLGSTVIGGGSQSPTASTALIAPISGDNALRATGKAHYKVNGSAPNRVLIVEWVDIRIPYGSSVETGTYCTFQALLYEGSGKIEFIYGRMYNMGTSQSRSIYFSSGTSAGQIGEMRTITATPTYTSNQTSLSLTSLTNTSDITNLNSTSDGTRRVFTFTPPAAPTAPTWQAATTVTGTTMQLNWTDNSSTESGFDVYRSTDDINYTYFATTAANATNYPASGLSFGTTYYWRIYAKNEGAVSAAASGSQATNAPSLSGDKTVGGSGTPDYATLTAAFAAINANGLAGNVNLILQSGYSSASETFPLATPSALAIGVNTVTIYPSVTGLSITSANTTGTILLDASKNVVFDGRVNATGSNKDLIIANTNAGASYAIRFVNDANNNILKYCKINSRNNSTSSGTIVFSTTTGTIGNDNNTIDNCDIYDGAAKPNNAIYSAGTSAKDNSGNTISNNNIYNFNGTTITAGIYILSNSTDWTISGNSFYQTAAYAGTASTTAYGIYINSGNNHVVTGNFIGGSAASCGSTAWTINGTAVTFKFLGIYLSVGATTASSVQNNTINNIDWITSSGTTTGAGSFCGISIAAGNVNVGNTTGNTLGSSTVDKLKLTSSAAALLVGINAASTGTVNISGNTIYGLTSVGTTAATGAYLTGIQTSGTAGIYTINNNTIGSTSIANSMRAGILGTTTGATYTVGITNAATGAISISGNTVGNLVSYGVNTSSNIRGIVSSAGVNTLTSNTVRDLSTPCSNVSTTSSASVIGISMTSTTTGISTVSQNTIFGLSNSHATAAVCVTGLHYAGPTTLANIVARNIIYGLKIVSTSQTADMRGINFASGLANVQNNIIRLGYDADGNALTTGIQITGLYDVTSTSNTGMYFNSIYIGGTGVGTQSGNTYAFRSNQTGNTRTYQNNIFVNARSNSTTGGKHYAVMVSGTGVNPTGLALNFNIYNVTGTGGVFGYYGADVASLAAWKTAIGQDANSINSDPLFNNATAATPNLHLTTGSPCESVGLAIAGITDDYDGETRSGLTPTDIGADAGDYAAAGIDMSATALVAPAATGCLTNTENVTVTVKNFSANTIDFNVNPVTVTVNVTGTVTQTLSALINSGTLASNASQNVSMSTTLNMSANGTYNFAVSTSEASDINTGNDALTPVVRTVSSFGGTYTVGAGGNFTTLTDAVNAYNNATCLTSAVVFNLTDADYSSGETFPITINANSQASATNTLTIKPTVTTTITGSNATALIKLNGADYVIIDGSNNGTTTKDLTISNANSGGSVIMLSSIANNAGATNNTIKNIIIKGGATTSGNYGIVLGGSTLASPGADNDNNTIQNNTISKAYIGIWAQGSTTSNPGLMDNLQVIGNSIGSATATDYITHDGIMVSNATGAIVSQNTIFNLIIASSTPVGITFGTGVISSTISKNIINNITATGTGGYGGRAIYVNTGNAASNLTIDNNIIYDIKGDGYTGFSNSSMVGMYFDGTTGGLNIYYNTVNMTGTFTRSGITLTTAILFNSSSITNIDLRNNIFVNTMDNSGSTTEKNYAIYSSTAFTNFTNINNNNYYVSGAQGILGYIGSDRTDLAGIVTGFGQNANSISVAPVFTSATDLHLDVALNSSLNAAGTHIAAVTTDIDGDTRDASTPDLGADEFTSVGCAGAVGGTASVTGSSSNCGPYTPVITASSYSVGTGSTYQWQYSNDNFASDIQYFVGQTNPASLTTGSVSATTYYRLKVSCTSGTAEDFSNIVTITINSLPTVAVSPTTASYCVSGSQVLDASGADTYSWSPATGLSTTAGASVTASPSITTTYTVTGTVTASGCINTATATITVNLNPIAVTITPSSATICEGSIQSLVASGGAPSSTILSENFNGGTNTWTKTNNSTGGTPSNAAWTLRADAYVYNTTYTFHSNDNSQFYLSNSDAQGSGTTATILQSPSFSTVGYSAANISFYHYHYIYDASSAKVEASIDGSNWTTLQTYTSNQGSINNFAHPSIALTAPFIDKPTVYIRFKYDASYQYFWAIDNVSVTGTPITVPITWFPTTDLYNEIGATTAYTGTAATTVYTKPTADRTYTATATNGSGCTSANTTAITFNPTTVAGTVAANASPILGGANAELTLSGQTGSITKWQKSFNSGAWSDIVSTANPYTEAPTALGTWSYRAVVKSGVCPTADATQADVLVNVNTTTFNGTTNNDWNTTGNWSNGVPSNLYNATIPANKLAVVNSNNYECNNLTIAPKGELTINAGKDLLVNGALLLQSDVTGTASLVDNGALVTSSNTAQRYIAKDNKWHFLSSPVAAQAIKPNFAPNTVDATFDFFKWDASADLTAPTSKPWINIRNLDGSYALGFDNFEVGKGYLVAYSSSYGGSETHEFTGTLNSGDKSIGVVYDVNNKFNLIGNPYPSAIDWNAAGYTNRDTYLKDAAPSIWVWNGTAGQYGAYIKDAALGTNDVTNVIAPHQGFFVEAISTGNFTIPNAARVHPGTQNFLKSTPVDLLKLKVSSTANTYSDEIIVNFNSNATANQGAAKWFSMITQAPSLYSVKNNKNFSINTLAALSSDLVVPVSFIAGVNGNYSIKASELASFANLSNLILKDLKTGITQNLLQNQVYGFAASTSDNANRFQLIFNSTTGINNPTNNQSVIYLTDNHIQIQSENQIDRVEIYNAIGQLVYQSNEKSNHLSVDASGFTRGTYIVRLIVDQIIQTQKLVINN